MLNITPLCVGELEANCFLVSDEQNNAIIIDPGAEGKRIFDMLVAQAMNPIAIVLTHAHFDHFGAAAYLMENAALPLYVHRLDAPLLLSSEKSMATGLGFGAQYKKIDETNLRTFEDGDVLTFSDELTLTVIHTPGHTPGSCCFRHGDILFSGDTLFRCGVGRVDFPGGNIHDMRRSLAKLGALEGDCEVYCGHYDNTTLEYERKFGHYLIPRKM